MTDILNYVSRVEDTQTPEHIMDEAMDAVMKVATDHDHPADDLAYDLALSLIALVFIQNAEHFDDVSAVLDADLKSLVEYHKAGVRQVQ